MFDFEPQVVFLSFCRYYSYTGETPYYDEASPAVAMIRGCPYFATFYVSPYDRGLYTYGAINKVNFNGNRVSWYIDQSPYVTPSSNGEQQFNGLPKEISGNNTYIRYYNYIGIG